MTEVQERRDVILSVAGEMFARKGINATTVREIANAVGMLSGSLYHYFESKDTMVEEIISGYLDAIQTRYADVLASTKDAATRLHDLVLTSLQVASEHPDATAMYQNELHYLRENERFTDVLASAANVQRTWLQVIEMGVAEGSFRDDISPRVFYRLIRDAVWLSIRWHHPDDAYSTHALAEDITSIFTNGFTRR